MKGMKIKYESKKTGNEETILAPYVSRDPMENIENFDRLYGGAVYSDVADVLRTELYPFGEPLEMNDGDEIVVNDETFTVWREDICGEPREIYKDSHGEHYIDTYSVTDADGNLMATTLDGWMTRDEVISEIVYSLTQPRQTPDGDMIQKRKDVYTSIETVNVTGRYTMYVKITDAAKAMCLSKGDRVKVTIERI